MNISIPRCKDFNLFVTSPIDMEPKHSFYSLPSPANRHSFTHSPSSKGLELEFCKQFECCAIIFGGLHDLLAHYEQDHDHAVNKHHHFPDVDSIDIMMPFEDMSSYNRAFRATSSDHVDARYVPMVDICSRRAIVNIMDPHMDTDESDDEDTAISSSSYAEPTALKRRTTRTRSTNSIKKRKGIASSVINAIHHDSADSTDTDVDIITVDDDDFVKKVHKLTILPLTPPTSDNEIDVLLRSKALYAPKPPQIEKIKKPRQSSLSILDPKTGERKYICAVEDCKKQYKNANGLKYHLSHAHPDGLGVPKEYLLFQKKKEEDGIRPYPCTVDGCEKKYKNLNGLKYHIEHYHSSLLPSAVTVVAAPASQSRINSTLPYPISMLQQSTLRSIYTAVFPPAPGPQHGSQK